MKLGFNASFESLYQRDGLLALDKEFLLFLDEALAARLEAARIGTEPDESALMLALAPHLEDFIGQLFGIGKDMRELAEKDHALAPLYACKRLFVQRRAAKKFKEEEVRGWDAAEFPPQEELGFAKRVMDLLENDPALEAALRYAAFALYHPEGQARHRLGVLFKLPRKTDPMHLLHPTITLRKRDGFALTDNGGTREQAQDHAHYCIYCHHQKRDSCSHGLKEKDGAFKVDALKVTLHGCPLEEKISEMNELKAHGNSVGALAVVCVDNPMCAGTGHRICNDCMKSCIYQKQEPVNIPLVESHVLRDVLRLPYGFEIYSLLTRWNPLNFVRPLPLAPTGKKVLVVGLGPAGYTLAHHLMNDGHTVLAIDGLKLEPLKHAFVPLKDSEALREPLESRAGAGFGGVAEYGITVRWDKNNLTFLRLLLERRAECKLVGGVRFGSTLTVEDAWALGFDHIALCLGAGKPTLLDIPNGLARGVRTASDFLMALQLTGAARTDSIANLQLRLPVVVIGGGLTAIDTATEALAYYPVQVEKFLQRYEALGDGVRAGWNEEEKALADEFIAHAKALRHTDDKLALLKKWGGVTIAYRKALTDAPSYRLNHEEVEKAFEEGICFAEHLEPSAMELDSFGHVKAVKFSNGETLPARAVLIAAGTSPNTVIAREMPEQIVMDGRYFRTVNEAGNTVTPERLPKPVIPQVLMSVEPDGRAISFFGDLHPSFAGNVVKAMASAKRGYPVVSRVLAKVMNEVVTGDFLAQTEKLLTATVREVKRLTPTIIEVIIHAPLAAKRFEPGQFYRLQNFEANAPVTHHPSPITTMAMESLAMTGAWVDKEQGLVSVIALEMGGSSNLLAQLKAGERVVLMGPTGVPTEITANETVLLAGGGLGNAVLFSIGKAFRARGSKVIYFAGYRKAADRYKQEEIEAAADVVVWCCDEKEIPASRPQDRSFHGNIIQAMLAHAATLPFKDVRRIIAIGSDGMMRAVAEARHSVLKPHLNSNHVAIGSINSPMQCMMKEICGQCLQAHREPGTGKTVYVYSCAEQDQLLDVVDFDHLRARLSQNSLPEKLTAAWLSKTLVS